jgi:glucose-6-phosphate 1-dehydrogenase
MFGLDHLAGNTLRFRVWPETEVALTLAGKKPGAGWHPEVEDLSVRPTARVRHARQADRRGAGRVRFAFARQDTVEAAWWVVDSILGDDLPEYRHPRATWGPSEADALLPSGLPGTTPQGKGGDP